MTRMPAAGWLLMAAGLLTALPAGADVELSLSAIRESVEREADGSLLILREPLRRLHGGDTLEITLHYVNNSDEPAENVRIDNPVPDGTLYMPGSATMTGADFQLSQDGGESWRPPGEDDRGVTNLRWVIPELPPHTAGDVRFRLLTLRSDIRLN